MAYVAATFTEETEVGSAVYEILWSAFEPSKRPPIEWKSTRCVVVGAHIDGSGRIVFTLQPLE
jgi:hypothetical protein